MLAQRFTVNSCVAYDQAGEAPAEPCLPLTRFVKGAVCLSRSFIIRASEPLWRERVTSNLKGSVKETPARGLSRDPLSSSASTAQI
jgi:hypothetical protein